MNFKSLNRQLLFRIVMLAIVAGAASWAIFAGSYVLAGILLFALIIIVFAIIHHYNSISRKFGFFFEAIRNEDSTLHFPEKAGDQFTRQLHSSLNKLNEIISEIKIKNEHNERFYRELLKYSSTGIMAVDEKDYVELINNSALRLLGMHNLGHMKLLGQKRNEVYRELVQLKPGQDRTIKYLRDQELQHLSVKVTVIHFGEKHFRVYSLYDIKAEMEENEVESWQKLIRVLTHEIMNSVAPITSLSATLQKLVNFDSAAETNTPKQIAQTREGLQVIEETGKGLMHFIDNYRRLTKIPKPVFKTMNIREWIDRVLLLMKERFENDRITVSVQYKTMQNQIIADEKLLTQVMINIINNAADATRGIEKPSVRIKVHSNDSGKLIISVTDNGKGIPDEEIDKVFIPFYTTKENGSGIGLSLSRQIMRLHKAGINIHSLEGKQTTVTLNF